MQNQIRAFIALELNKEVKKELANIQKKLKEIDGDIAWVDPENFHLSLNFLGNIDQGSVPTIEKILKNVCKKIKEFQLALDILGVFPYVSSPRVIWIGIGSGYNSVTLANTLIDAGLKENNFRIKEKHFHPHITLGRAKNIRDIDSFSKMIDTLKPHCRSIDIKKLTLFKSELNSDGAVYTKIAETNLGKV